MSESDYVKRARETARQHARRNGTGSRRQAADPPGAPEPPELGIRISTVQPEPVDWVWPGRIPRGKLTIIDGDPGRGKSTLTLDIAARVSTGQPMPFEELVRPRERRTPAGVVLLTAEDSLSNTVRPRLEAAGADLERIKALDWVPDDPRRPPKLPDDVNWLRKLVRECQAGLVVIDPWMAFLAPGVNAHRDQDVRRALHPLSVMADETGAAVLIVRHLNKAVGGSPLHRGGGSIGIIGAARSSLLVGLDPDDPDRCILAGTKCNLGKLPPSLAYRIEAAENGAGRIHWIGESAHTAEDLLANRADDGNGNAINEAVEVLTAILADGPKPTNHVKHEATEAGVALATLRRAKARLQVRAVKDSFAGCWWWCLPHQVPESAEGAQAPA